MTNVRKKNTTKESYMEADDYKKMITSIDETWPLDNKCDTMYKTWLPDYVNTAVISRAPIPMSG